MQHEDASARREPARHERSPAERAADVDSGAHPSLTAPANSTQILRHGIDSVYVSFPGLLSEDSQQQLTELKELAQDEHESMQARAVLVVGEHQFCVASHGRRRFPFVIDDNWFSVALASRTAKSLPMAHAQISSELLTSRGAVAALSDLTAIVQSFGELTAPPQLSRVDLFADFTTDTDIESLSRDAWLKRSRKRAIYEESDAVTGVAFGLGGDLSCRIYNKLGELEKSGKLYLLPLWESVRWNGVDPVWRIEFQMRRDILQQLQAPTLPALLERLRAIWTYLTEDWLRLTIPNPDDDTRTRWPTHPMWQRLSALEGISTPSAARVSRARIPLDTTLFRQGLAGVTSFMAREGITNFDQGIAAFLHAAKAYHAAFLPPGQGNDLLLRYVNRKVNAKFRRFNTVSRRDPE